MTRAPTSPAATLRRLLVAAFALTIGAAAAAHDATLGDIHIGHPFAVPTVPGATTGAAYLKTLENHGDKPDKLLHVSTPAADRVEMHTMNVDARGIMRMREVDGIALAPKQVIPMQPGMGMHLMLIDLKAPLKDGDSFPMQLQFERAGKVTVKVIVQKPRAGDAAGEMHMH